MGNFKISDHLSRDHFSCKCGKCDNEFKISLTIVGILEHLRSKFNGRVNILRAYLCEDRSKELYGHSRDYHHMGKAVDFNIENADLSSIFREVESMQEIKGLGFSQTDNYIHIDIRDKDREVWVKENSETLPLNDSKRRQYQLYADNAPPPDNTESEPIVAEPEPVSIETTEQPVTDQSVSETVD